MVLAHNVTLRHLNSIYLQATGVHESEDIKDFLFFCKTWVDELHEHHKGEEEKLFPMLDRFTGVRRIMSKCEDQHKAFFPGVEAFSQYVQGTSIKDYDGKKLRELIDVFADALILHLYHEPLELLGLGEKYGGTKLKKVWDKFEADLIKDGMSKWDKVLMILVLLYPSSLVSVVVKN
jgi:hemerythrin-like domain-containing protein